MPETIKHVDTVELRARLEAQITARKNVDAKWSDVEQWVAPLSGGVDPTSGPSSDDSVRRNLGHVWDSTAILGASRLAASIYTNITNPALRWARMKWKEQKLQDDTDAASWLDSVSDMIFAELASSDFYTEIAAFDEEWTRFCTACFVAEVKRDALTPADWKGYDFTAPPVRECYFEPDAHGAVFRFWRVFDWTPVQIVSKFGANKVPDKVRAAAANPTQSAERMKVVYAVYVRPERMGKPKKAPVEPMLRPVGTCYFLKDTAEMLGEENGLYEMNVFMVPWARTAGSTWGHGPGTDCIGDVKYLNERLEQLRVAREKAVDPPWLAAERSILGQVVDMRPGQGTVVRDVKDVVVFESASKIHEGEKDVADLRAQIRAHFWTDELELKLSPQMTATEVNARIDQMQRLFGPTLSALQSMLLDPLLKLAFDALYRAGKLPKMPGAVQAAVNRMQETGEYAIEYQGPLSRAQRTDEVAGIERVASAASAMLKMGFEDVRQVFNEEAALREIAKRLGTPASILFSETQVAEAKRKQAEIQQRLAAAEAARAEGEAVQQGADARAAAGQVPSSVPASPPPILSPELM